MDQFTRKIVGFGVHAGALKANLRILNVTEIKTVSEVPLSHPFIERLVGTMRRELLDQVPFLERRGSRTEAVALQGLLQPRSRSCVVGWRDARLQSR